MGIPKLLKIHASSIKKKIIRYFISMDDALFMSNFLSHMRKYYFSKIYHSREIGIDSLRRRVFVYLGSDLYGTHSEQRGQCLGWPALSL